MACNTIDTRIVSHKLSRFLFLSIFLALHTTQSLRAEIELFSLSHNDQDGLKINILYRTIHDEEALKKEIAQAKFHKKSLEIYSQEIKKIEEKRKETEHNIELKKAILQKKFMELNVK